MTLQLAKASTTRAPKAPKVPYDLEVVPLLRAIQRTGGSVDVRLPDIGAQSVSAKISGVDGSTGRLHLRFKDEYRALFEQAAHAECLTVHANRKNASVQFSVESPRILDDDSSLELQVDIGEQFLSYDRRRYYRLCVPLADHVRCMLSFHAEDKNVHVQVGVVDISEGGVALLCKPDLLDTTIGRRYQECRIELPGTDSFSSQIEVRNVMQHEDGGEQWVRIGCSFVGMAGVERMLIRHFIDQVEYHWRDWLPSLDFVEALAA
jgi:flagellar brake protein